MPEPTLIAAPHGQAAVLPKFTWNLVGQAGVALLGLLLIKLSVSLFSVPAYGAASLLLGLHAFARGLALNPILLLAIYATPREGQLRGKGWIYETTNRAIGLVGLLTLPLLALAAWSMRSATGVWGIAMGLILAILWLDAIKTARLNLLHCNDQAKRFAFWTLLDAAVKPGVVLLLAWAFPSRGPLLLLTGHMVASALLLSLTHLDSDIRKLSLDRVPGAAPVPSTVGWLKTHAGFLLPLVGLGGVAWVTGVGDRYLVNFFLGTKSAGLYIGIYAIFASPFLVLNSVFLLTLRPTLMRLQGQGLDQQWQRVHRQGMLAMGGCALLLALGLHLFRSQYTGLLLAPAYAVALGTAPGILAGNAVQSVGTFLELSFFLRNRIQLTLLKQAFGSVAALGLAGFAIPRWGLQGASWACLGYALLELTIGATLLAWSATTPDPSHTP